MSAHVTREKPKPVLATASYSRSAFKPSAANELQQFLSVAVPNRQKMPRSRSVTQKTEKFIIHKSSDEHQTPPRSLIRHFETNMRASVSYFRTPNGIKTDKTEPTARSQSQTARKREIDYNSQKTLQTFGEPAFSRRSIKSFNTQEAYQPRKSLPTKHFPIDLNKIVLQKPFFREKRPVISIFTVDNLKNYPKDIGKTPKKSTEPGLQDFKLELIDLKCSFDEASNDKTVSGILTDREVLNSSKSITRGRFSFSKMRPSRASKANEDITIIDDYADPALKKPQAIPVFRSHSNRDYF